jgi:hypothetical protein
MAVQTATTKIAATDLRVRPSPQTWLATLRSLASQALEHLITLPDPACGDGMLGTIARDSLLEDAILSRRWLRR